MTDCRADKKNIKLWKTKICAKPKWKSRRNTRNDCEPRAPTKPWRSKMPIITSANTKYKYQADTKANSSQLEALFWPKTKVHWGFCRNSFSIMPRAIKNICSGACRMQPIRSKTSKTKRHYGFRSWFVRTESWRGYSCLEPINLICGMTFV